MILRLIPISTPDIGWTASIFNETLIGQGLSQQEFQHRIAEHVGVFAVVGSKLEHPPSVTHHNRARSHEKERQSDDGRMPTRILRSWPTKTTPLERRWTISRKPDSA